MIGDPVFVLAHLGLARAYALVGRIRESSSPIPGVLRALEEVRIPISPSSDEQKRNSGTSTNSIPVSSLQLKGLPGFEAAWSYQYPARIAKEKAEILVRLPKKIRDIAWKAQTRLCTRYRSMVARGKKPTVVVAAIARERAGFIWAIGLHRLPGNALATRWSLQAWWWQWPCWGCWQRGFRRNARFRSIL